jgi:hypothetical protein
MLFLVFMVTITVTLIGFLSNGPQEVIINPLYSYYIYVARYIWANMSLFFWLWVLIALSGVIFQGFKSDISWGEKAKAGIVQATLVTILGFLLSGILVFVMAGVEMNVLAVWFNNNPESLGVVTDQMVIAEKLKNFTSPPKIITAQKDHKTELIAVTVAMAGKDNFYGSFVLPYFPRWLIMPIAKPTSSLILVDDTLIVTEINPKDIQDISAEVGYLFVKRNFPSRDVKYYPKVLLMDGDEYQKFRQDDFASKLKMVDGFLAEAGNSVKRGGIDVERSKESVSQLEEVVKQIYTTADEQYFECVNSKATDCDEKRGVENQRAVEMSGELEKAKSNLADFQKEVSNSEQLVSFYQSQKKIGQSLVGNIPSERGVFVAPDEIRLTWEERNANSVADYFESLTHEYLHYTSFQGEDKKLADPFFEEGLTEYYARMAIKDNLEVSTNLGYPVIVKIISKIAKNIPDSDLASIYFSKDQKGLEIVLDRVYGKDFYKDSRVIFATLQYSQEASRILPLANIIMEKIHGEPLTERDLVSSFSSY